MSVRRQPPTPQTPFLVGEVLDIPFRFGGEMTPEETIVDVAVSCVVVAGVDGTPLGRVSTPHQVQERIKVVQRFSGDIEGVRYVVGVAATTSLGHLFIAEALVTVLPRNRP